MKNPVFLHVETNSLKLKNDSKTLGRVHYGRRTLKLAISHKEINGINWFLLC